MSRLATRLAWAGLVVCLSAGVLPAAAADAAQEAAAIFSAGNDHYAAGEYEDAAQHYRQLLTQGYTGPAVHYNLGNALYKLKQLGPAILEYEKAAKLAPNDPDIEANLEFARSLTADRTSVGGARTTSFFIEELLSLTTLDQDALMLTVVWLVLSALAAVLIVTRSPAVKRLMIWSLAVVAIPLLVLGASFGFKQYREATTVHAIVLKERVDVKSGPGEDNTTLFTVHEGLKVRVRNDFGFLGPGEPGQRAERLGDHRLARRHLVAASALVFLAVVLAAPGHAPAAPRASVRAAALAEMGDDPPTARSGRYRVTAGPRASIPEGTATRLAYLLVSFDRAYRRMWQPLDGGRISTGEVEVYLFAGRPAMDRALSAAAVTAPPFETGGAFLPGTSTLLVARESPLDRALEASLLHEAAHLLNGEILGGGISPWLNEGLAQYCQYSAITAAGEVELGTIAGESILRVPRADGEVQYRFVPRRSVSYLLGQFRRDPNLSLGPLLDTRSPGPFYGQEAQLHYAASWTLVHLLADGRIRRIGELRPFLFRYAELEREGGGGRETLLGLLGVSLEDLDDAWYRHVKRLR